MAKPTPIPETKNSREATDIFALQKEVSKKIANEIEAIITPEEEERIDQLPTEDLLAYDYFLRGQDLFFRGPREGILESIPYFQKAVKQDPELAHAYADIAIAYYVLDMLLAEKIYADSINLYAEQVKAYILYAKNGDLNETRDLLLETLQHEQTKATLTEKGLLE